MKSIGSELLRLRGELESQDRQWQAVCAALEAGRADLVFPREAQVLLERVLDTNPPPPAAASALSVLGLRA